MRLKYRLAGGAIGAVAVILIALVLQSTGFAPSAPPLTGWMKNFTPLEAPTPAPQTVFTDGRLQPRRFTDFAGKVVIVNFWATWCLPCIREMPTLIRLAKRLGEKDFAVIALSEDRKGWPVIQPFLEKQGFTELAVYHDVGGRTMNAFRIMGLPTTIVIDRKGRVVGRLVGVAEWDADEAVALMRYYARN